MLSLACGLLMATLTLDGVSGSGLCADASFDANNVSVGDPLTLTLDFAGDVELETIHPPALAAELDAALWRVDDTGAQTTTCEDRRLITYRVRPLQDGVLVFPALTFAYRGAGEDARLTASTLPVPVRVRARKGGLPADFGAAGERLPGPDGIIIDLDGSPWGSGRALSDDELFAWRKACTNPTAEAFAGFSFPEARLNEAACELLAGNWRRALDLYGSLEWRIGQTESIERGMIAALARKTGDPEAELPMWRRVFRPVLRFALWGRVFSVLGFIVVVALCVWGLRRAIRALACLAVLGAMVSASTASAAPGADPFAELERMQQRMHQQMQSMMNGGAFGALGGGSFTVNGQPVRETEVKVSAAPAKTPLVVGETFDLIVTLEAPKSTTIQLQSLRPSNVVGFSFQGDGRVLEDVASASSTNVIHRFAIPVRYDAPFTADLTFEVAGLSTTRVSQRAGGSLFSSTFSNGFATRTAPVRFEVRPLGDDNRPEDYAGAVGAAFRLVQRADRQTVATNDVVRLTCTLAYDGFLPTGAIPGARPVGRGAVAYTRYFVADGSPATPEETFVYYDVKAKDYRRLVAPGVKLDYVAEQPEEPAPVAAAADRRLGLRFFPSESAPEIARIEQVSSPAVTERRNGWVRVDTGRHAGWIREEELP